MAEQTRRRSSESLREAVEHGRRKHWWRLQKTRRQEFRYVDSDGAPVSKEESHRRIEALRIPPAWQEVRVAPSPRSPLQAVGIDSLGRIQYLYQARFAAKQQEKKFARIERFGEALPALRRKIAEDMACEGWPRQRVLALIVRLMDCFYFRLGSEKSVTEYRTFGVTTLRNCHLRLVNEGLALFRFTGKHHILQRKQVTDVELIRLLQEVRSIKGKELFHYLDANGMPHNVTGSDVNGYIKAAAGAEFSAKDFRTWGGTLLAATALEKLGTADSDKKRKSNISKAVRQVAGELGNTPAVCRGSYIHPVVLDRYHQGMTLADFQPKKKKRSGPAASEYRPEEIRLLRLFRCETGSGQGSSSRSKK